MKIVTKLVAVATLATFMFAGMNVTWGNMYSSGDDGMEVGGDFGVWFDMNDATSIGWEGDAMKIGLAGPAGLTFRMGYGTVTTLGVGRSWWSSTGNGWATSLNTTIDFDLVDSGTNSTDDKAGTFSIGVNLGFGF